MSPANPTGIERELVVVHEFYAAMTPLFDSEHALGGRLIFAGELDESGCCLVRAANIAGAASLAASADSAVARQAMRDGVIDFVVNSLDEALRILKNEVRKRQPVAVGVTISLQHIVTEMLERGVLPDLLPPAADYEGADLSGITGFQAQGARCVVVKPLSQARQFVMVPVPGRWSQRSAELDGILSGFIAPDDHVNQRWLHLAPRYLGPQARRIRSLECDAERVADLLAQIS